MKLTKQRSVENFGKPYVIAELASSHNGDMEIARQMILAAKKAGADCVKFQSWTKDSIFSQKQYDANYFLADDYRNRDDYSLVEIVEKFSISEQQLLEMKQFTEEIGIDCASTALAFSEIDFLVDTINVPFLKVASMDINNYPFLDYLARKGLPMIVSTGFGELSEIDRAVRTIEKAGNEQIILLHCVASYPPDNNQIHLNKIATLRQLYPQYPIGFSDHTFGTSIPLAAVALGACVIEKHFTLDKNMFGWDHKISADPAELQSICEQAELVWQAMGSGRMLPVEDNEKRLAFRRSIVLRTKVKAGDMIKAEDIDWKRPGTGIPPEYSDMIVGRTARNDIKKDYPFSWDDLV